MGKNDLEELQKDVKVLKNEVKTALLDIREYLLTRVENPFSVEMTPGKTATGPGERVPDAARPSIGAAADPDQMSKSDGGPFAKIEDVPGGIDVAGVPTGGKDKVLGNQVNQRIEIRSEGSRNDMNETPKKVNLPRNGDGGNGKGGGQIAGLAGILDQGAPGETRKREPEIASEENTGLDLVTVAMLSTWVEASIDKLGSERLNLIVDVYALMGRIGPQLRDVLLKLASLGKSNTAVKEVTMRDCLQVLMDLDHMILRSHDRDTAAALFSLFKKQATIRDTH